MKLNDRRLTVRCRRRPKAGRAKSLASEAASLVTPRLQFPWGSGGVSLHGLPRARGSPEAPIPEKGVAHPGHTEINSVGAKGAGIGAGTGAAAGFGTAASRSQTNVVAVPAGSLLRFELSAPLSITVMEGRQRPRSAGPSPTAGSAHRPSSGGVHGSARWPR